MKRAVVMGASMAGLLSARVLSEHFDRVDVLERDVDPGDAPLARKGVPQGRHVHGLLRAGEDVFESYFPGFVRELHEAGVEEVDHARDFAWFQHGSWKLRQPLGLAMQMVSRPLLESTLLRRVRALRNVHLHYGRAIEGPAWDGSVRRVRGVRHAPALDRSASPELLEADLVVDARGRGSKLVQELTSWGFEKPAESRAGVDLHYSSRVYRATASTRFPWRMLAIYPSAPTWTRGGALFPLEGDRYICTLMGYVGDRPPSDGEGFAAFARELEHPALGEALAQLLPETEPAGFHFPYTRRLRFDRLSKLPAGIVALGDAVCSLDPVFGQGMTTSALGTTVLDEWLRSSARDELTFFRKLARTQDVPWLMTTCEGFRYPQVTGARPPAAAVIQACVKQAFLACSQHADVYGQLLRVLHMKDAPFALLKPAIVWKVLTGSLEILGARSVSPTRSEYGTARSFAFDSALPPADAAKTRGYDE